MLLNVNILRSGEHKDTCDFVNCMLSYSYYPLITKPTRITNTSKTLIDNIYCSNLMLVSQTLNGLLCTDISDHLPIFTILPSKSNEPRNADVYHRPITSKGMAIFKAKVADTNWDNVVEHNDVQIAYSCFNDMIHQMYCDSFPLRKMGNHKKADKPWINESLKKCIKTKNKLYVYFRKHPILFNELKYKVYKRTLRKVLIKAEREYYDTKFRDCGGDVKQAWAILKNILGTKKQTDVNKEFVINGETVADGQSIVNGFNECFVNLGPKLAAKIVNNNGKQATDYIGNRNVHSMFVVPVTEEETTNIIKGLRNNSSPGWDGIKTSLVKEICDTISKPLTYIINLSLEKGIVPDELKIARVVPIFKGGDKKEQTNYRPVSVLPCMSKILEK